MEYRESHQMLVLRLGGLRHQCEPSLKLSHTIKPWVFETIWYLSSLSNKFSSPPPYKPIPKEPVRLPPTRDYQPVFWYEDRSGSYMDKILCLPPSLAPWLHNKGMPVKKKIKKKNLQSTQSCRFCSILICHEWVMIAHQTLQRLVVMRLVRTRNINIPQ